MNKRDTFWVGVPVSYKTTEGWRDALLVAKGTALLLKSEGAEERTAVVTEVRTEIQTLPVFNLEVANAHTFFVGGEGALVHNNKCKKLRKDLEELLERGHKKIRGKVLRISMSKVTRGGFVIRVGKRVISGGNIENV